MAIACCRGARIVISRRRVVRLGVCKPIFILLCNLEGQVDGAGGEVDANLWQLCASLIIREGEGESVVGTGFVGRGHGGGK